MMIVHTRFEEYARWKAGRLPLHRVPDDVLGCIAERLSSVDLESLLCAYFGFKPDLACSDSHRALPMTLRTPWISKRAVHDFEQTLRTLAERAIFHCPHVPGRQQTSSVVALVDWSPFSQKPVCPVAEYGWTYPNAKVIVHMDRLFGHAISCSQRAMPAVRVSLHRHICLYRENIIDPTPILAVTHCMFPHFTMR